MNEMHCDNCQKWLHGYLDNELDTTTATSIAEHLKSCPKCNQVYEGMRVLKAGIREHIPTYEMPSSLSRSVFAKIEAEAHSTMWDGLQNMTKHWGAPLFSAAAVAAAFLLYIATPSTQDEWVDEAVSDHVRSLMVGHLNDVISSDRHTVKPWFSGKLDFSPPVYDFTAQGYPLVGGRLDYLQHQNVAAISYMHNKHVINVFIAPVASTDSVPKNSSERGYNVIYWQQNRMRYVVVSDLNTGDLRIFTELLQKGM